MHLSLRAMDGSIVTQLTSGDWDVEGIAAYDANSQTLFFLSRENDPKLLELFSVQITFTGSIPDRVYLAPNPGYYGVSFSPSSSFYLLNYYGINIPTSTLINTTDSCLRLLFLPLSL